MLSRVPLIVILGSTGSGKTKLSLEIAEKFSGEIISADSIQVYKGLDIISAKATPEERNLAPHHLLNIIDPTKKFTVVDFRNRAVKIIDDLLQKKKMPIVVGGTNYYIESLLWDILVQKSNSSSDSVKLLSESEMPVKKIKLDDSASSQVFEEPPVDLNVSNEELHEKLKQVDPEMADKLHPNNRRKIIRALQVQAQQGRRLSDILREQHAEGGCPIGGPLRYPQSLILWLQCEQTVLDERLDSRVDSMVEQGLLKELTDFHSRYNEERLKDNTSAAYTEGVFQSIGFKEFHEYLLLNSNEKNTEQGQKLFDKGLKNLKIVTKRYARKQKRWIENRFLGHVNRQIPLVYGLNTTDLSLWKTEVMIPTIEIIEAYMKNETCHHSPLPVKQKISSEPMSLSSSHFCNICQRIFIGEIQWKAHLNSAKHQRTLKRQEKNEKHNLQSMDKKKQSTFE